MKTDRELFFIKNFFQHIIYVDERGERTSDAINSITKPIFILQKIQHIICDNKKGKEKQHLNWLVSIMMRMNRGIP